MRSQMPSSATDRAAVERILRALVTAALTDRSRADAAVRQAASALVGGPSDAEALALLRAAEARHGRREAAGVVARTLVDRRDPLAVETAAHRLRDIRRRHETERAPIAHLAAE